MGRYVAEDVAERVVNSHGYNDHLSDFNNPSFGQPLNINSREELKEHLVNVLESSDTRCFTSCSSVQKSWREADIYYNERTNTMVINPVNQEPTTYRPEDGIEKFESKLDEAERIEQGQISIVHGINELNPEHDKAPLSNTAEQVENNKIIEDTNISPPKMSSYAYRVHKTIENNRYDTDYNQENEIDNGLDIDR